MRAPGFAFLLCLAAPLVGCSSTPEPPVPADPSYETDVRPILLGRCVSCHGAGGTLQGDPPGSPLAGPPPNGYLDHYEDQGNCGNDDGGVPDETCKRGAAYEAPTIHSYVNLPGDDFRMPPPPRPRLAGRELQIVTTWSAGMPPKP